MKLSTIHIVTLAVILIAVVLLLKAEPRENFADVLGMMETQRVSYDHCLSECERKSESHFADTYAPTRLLCERKCNAIADEGVRDGRPDMHIDDHNRNFTKCVSSPDQEQCSCNKEIQEWCKSTYCPFSKSSECQSDCERINSYKCSSGMRWHWKP